MSPPVKDITHSHQKKVLNVYTFSTPDCEEDENFKYSHHEFIPKRVTSGHKTRMLRRQTPNVPNVKIERLQSNELEEPRVPKPQSSSKTNSQITVK